MKNILVPCDFSKSSREAFKFAVDLATQTAGKVLVLHVVFIPTLYDSTTGMPMNYDPVVITGIEDDARKEFEKLKRDMRSSVQIDFMARQGEVIPTIEQVILTEKIDLVAMGTVGTSGLREFFIGSTTEKVVRNSSAPVFTMRTAPELSSIKKILLPSQLELNQNEFITKVKALQEFFHASLHILHISTPSHFKKDSDANEAFKEFESHYKLTNCTAYFRNDHTEEDGIIDFARNAKMDLIAMGTHSRKGVAHLFNGSITEDVVNHISCPVWTYTIKK